MEKSALMQEADAVFMPTYGRYPLALVRGEGATVWDENGKAYTDFVAGIAVCSLGHSHPGVAAAIAEQAKTLVHVSNLYYTVPQTELARWLVDRSFADKVFLCNSGAEANEGAVKLARKYFKDHGEPGRYRVIAMEGSFHGRTLATAAATGQEKIQKGFEPMPDGFDHVPFNDLDAVRNAVTESTAAVLVEPVQGEGGVKVPAPDYLKNLKALCAEAGILLIYDEVQTGMGRTGALFAHEHFDAPPDIMTLAKALGNGLPVGAVLAREEVAASFTPGSHATTFGGTPLIAAGALATVRALEEEGLTANARHMGAYLRERLEGLKSKRAVVEEVRGLGLMAGLKLAVDGAGVVTACQEKGYLVNCIQGNVLRFVPPLVITEKDVDGLAAVLDEVLKDL